MSPQKIKTEKLTKDIFKIGKSCIDLGVKESIMPTILPKKNIAWTYLIQQGNDSLREPCVLDGFDFISNDISKTHWWKDETRLEDLGTNNLAGTFRDTLKMFILSTFSEYSWLYADKHLKGLYCNIGVLIPDNSLSPEIISDVSNLGSLSSN